MNDMDSHKPVRRILIVEDEPGLQEALALTLELEGFEVVRASDGQEALARLDKPLHLIVTDYIMPRMNGMEMIQHIRANKAFAGVPIILLSAALPPDLDESTADVILRKPVTIARLLETITKLLVVA